MITLMTVGFILVIISFFISRSISQRAAALLSDEERDKINKEFATMRKWDLAPFAVIFTIHFIGVFFFPEQLFYFTAFMITSIVIYFIVSHKFIFDKFKELKIPEEYVKQIFLSRAIIYTGLSLLLIMVLMS